MKRTLFLCSLLLFWACTDPGSLSAQKRPGKGRETPPAPGPGDRSRNESLYVEACTQMIRGDYNSAAELFMQVATADPGNHAALYNLCKILTELRQYDEAILRGNAALQGDPNNPWYYRSLSQAYELKGDFAGAVSVLEKLLQKYPLEADDRLSLSELYQRKQDLPKSLEQLGKIEAQKGPSEEISFRKYRLHRESGDLYAALKESLALIRQNPAQSRYVQFQYETLVALGKQAEGVTALEQAVQRDPQNGYALLALADYYKNIQQEQKSEDYLQLAFKNPGISPEGKLQLVQRLLNSPQASDRSRATRLARLIEEVHPGFPGLFSIKGELFAAEGQADSARAYVRRALDAEPANTGLWLKLLEISFDARDFAQSNRDAAEALEFYPNDVRFLYFYGVSSSLTGQDDKALSALEKIRRIGSADKQITAQACGELGRIYHRKQDYVKSDEAFQRALELSPADPYVLHHYAKALFERRERTEEALAMNTRAMEGKPGDASFHETEGDLLFRAGKTEEARSQWDKAIQLGAKFSLEDKLKGQ